MRNPNSQINLLFFSTLIALVIWIASPTVKGEELHVHSHQNVSFPFAEYAARYTLNWHGIPAGESIHILKQRADGQYHFQVRAEPTLKLIPFHHTESSDFIWLNGKILPQNYYYNRKEGKRHRVGNVCFDYQNKKLTNKTLSEPWEEKLPSDVQDKITQALSLRYALKIGSNTFNYIVAEEDKLKDYHFTLLGEEHLTTKLGTLITLKVEHISRKNARTTMWLAKELDYLPVKMTQHRQGKIVADGEILSFTPKAWQAKK